MLEGRGGVELMPQADASLEDWMERKLEQRQKRKREKPEKKKRERRQRERVGGTLRSPFFLTFI